MSTRGNRKKLSGKKLNSGNKSIESGVDSCYTIYWFILVKSIFVYSLYLGSNKCKIGGLYEV